MELADNGLLLFAWSRLLRKGTDFMLSVRVCLHRLLAVMLTSDIPASESAIQVYKHS